MYNTFYEIINSLVLKNDLDYNLIPNDLSSQIDLIKICNYNRCTPIIQHYLAEKTPKAISLYLRKEQIYMKDIINKSFELQKLFLDNEIKFAFNKGPFVSYYIYNDPYARHYDDIDCFVDANDVLKACNLIELNGFHDSLINQCVTDINYDLDENDLFRKKLIKSAYELHYRKDNCLFEIKKGTADFTIDMVKDAVTNVETVNFNNYNFSTLNITYTFLYLVLNIVDNFFSYWGVYAYFCVRDIIDVCIFIKRYSSEYQNEFIEIVTKYHVEEYLMRCKLLVKSYLKNNVYQSLPDWFKEFDYPVSKNIRYSDWILSDLNFYCSNSDNRISKLEKETYCIGEKNSVSYSLNNIHKLQREWIKLDSTFSENLLDRLPEISFEKENNEFILYMRYNHFPLNIKIQLNVIQYNSMDFVRKTFDIDTDNESLQGYEFINNVNCGKSDYITSVNLPISAINKYISNDELDSFLYVYANIYYGERKVATLGKSNRYYKLIY